MRRINWMQIVVTALITGAVTVAAGWGLWRIQSRDPRLTYSTAETIPFTGTTEITAIYQVSVANTGQREVEDVACHIEIPGGRIIKWRVLAAPSMASGSTVTTSGLDFTADVLNPSESVQILVLATAPKALPSKPDVSLRGKGAVGVVATNDGKTGYEISWMLAAGIASIVGGTLSAWMLSSRALSKLGSQDSTDMEEHGHWGDQSYVLAYLCRINGLSGLADEYETAGVGHTHYWFEADRLALHALRTTDDRQSIEKVLLQLLDYASVADSSRAIVLLNLAKLAAASKDSSRATEYVHQAEKANRGVVRKRLSIDPIISGGVTVLPTSEMTRESA